MTPPAAILSLTRDADALVSRLVAWCDLNTGSTNLAGLSRFAAMLESACRELADDVTLIPVADDGRCAVRARRRPDAPRRVLLSGHYDTVYGPEHPFQQCRFGAAAKLHGPGVADMKGGIVTMLAALHAFENTPGGESLGWEVLLTPDEEIGSDASRPVLEAAAQRNHFGLVFEAARDNGDLVLGRKGRGIVTVRCHGEAGHAAGGSGGGRNAIVALGEFVAAAHRLAREWDGVLLNVARFQGGGLLNIIPAFAEAQWDLRLARSDQTTAVSEELRTLAATIGAREDCTLELDLDLKAPPLVPGTPARAAFAAWQECARHLGLVAPGGRDVNGTSDANRLAATGLPCLDGVGPVGGNFHSENEWVDLTSLVPRAQLAALFLHRLALGEISFGAVKSGTS